MAPLPDPTGTLHGDDAELYEHMAQVRAGAEGRSSLGDVYVRMLNNPGVTAKVGALGEQLRFHGLLPDAPRELAILRFAARNRLGYVWAHHQRPARLAGLTDEVIAQLLDDAVPTGLDDLDAAVVQAVDAVAAHRSIPAAVQERIVEAHGAAAAVELVALCGLYALMGYTTAAFDVTVEDGLPTPPF